MLTALSGPMPALPLDLFRVLVGLLSTAYFTRTLREVPDFGAADGLINQDLQRRLLPFTCLGLFPKQLPPWLLRAAYLTGCTASVMLALGVGTAIAAPLLYLLAVSAYRRGFLVIGVDDAIIHLSLFWMVVLPVGHTLTLPDLFSRPESTRGIWESWRATTVAGLGVHCLLINLALIYATAGLWKLTSPLWKSGSALRVVLAMPVAYGLGPHLATWPATWLRVCTWGVLLAEPLGALLLGLPSQCWQVWPILALVIALHGGIIATVRVPLANLAMLAALVSFVAVPSLLTGSLHSEPTPIETTPPLGWIAVGVVACLTGQIALDALIAALGLHGGPPTNTGRVMNPFYAPLWILGLAQSYRLLDWVDARNYDVRYEVVERCPGSPAKVIDAARMFPRTMRHVLLQSYLFGDLWVALDPNARSALRTSILTRYANRYARVRKSTPNSVEVEVRATIHRVTADGAGAHRASATLMTFPVEAGSTTVHASSVTYPDNH